MKIVDCVAVGGYTVLALDDPLPTYEWRTLVVGGVGFDPVPVMDAGNDCIAVAGAHDFEGEDVTFK